MKITIALALLGLFASISGVAAKPEPAKTGRTLVYEDDVVRCTAKAIGPRIARDGGVVGLGEWTCLVKEEGHAVYGLTALLHRGKDGQVVGNRSDHANFDNAGESVVWANTETSGPGPRCQNGTAYAVQNRLFVDNELVAKRRTAFVDCEKIKDRAN